MTTTPEQALERAGAYLATNRPGVTAVGLWEDSRDYMVSLKYPHDLFPLGEAAILVRKDTGRVWTLASCDVGRKSARMREVISASTDS